ncbi:MAG: UDP-glucose/GDP-mannose dehydrogenase family protein [Ignavibacteriales bacterium]|nr:UDP-glucose/GDP-mannose dehydrogenase family protein [Ignavibacteriales bacterium]
MKIAIIGTGYVGLVTGTCLAETGNQVICVDNNQEKLARLLKAEVPIYEPGLDLLFQRNLTKQRLSFTADLAAAVLQSEYIFLCLPTPQDEDGSADLQYILGVAGQIGEILHRRSDSVYRVIVNKSTVPVGTAGKVAALLRERGAQNFDIVSNPEFLREGFAVEDFMKPDRIVVGSDSRRAFDMMKLLYDPFVRQGNPIIEMNTASSEVTKYAANSYLAMRITYMNELANFMGTDSRIGKRFLFPGIGYGGSCFPKDVNALIKTADDAGSPMKILAVVDQVNREQKSVLVRKVVDHFGGSIAGRHFGVWGLAFKPNTDDMREAPSVVIIRHLLKHGATVTAYDPAAAETARFYLHDTIRYAENEYDALTGADALLVLTEWNEFRTPDFQEVKKRLKQHLIFDGRNIFTPEKMEELHITYYGIGRPPVKI